MVHINDFLLADEALSDEWDTDGVQLAALLERVALYERGEGGPGVESVIEAARNLLGSYTTDDSRARLVQGPQFHLVSGILMAFLAERVVIQDDEAAARAKQADLCAAASAYSTLVEDLDAELDGWIDADFQDVGVEIECTKKNGGGPCPTTKTGKKIKVLKKACFTAPDGMQECSSSARHETWKWKHGKWKVYKPQSDVTPTNAQLEQEAEQLLATSKGRRLDDARRLVLGAEDNRGAFIAELDRIAACEQVPGFVPPAEPEPEIDLAFCDEYAGREVLLEISLSDGSRQTVQVRTGQDVVYRDPEVAPGEFASFMVNCDGQGRVILMQPDVAGAMSAAPVTDASGYGTIALVAAGGAAQRPESWLTPLSKDGLWTFRTAQGRYLLADDGDGRLGQGEQPDVQGAKFAVILAD
ncbi:MAG: hypothetical protein AB1Z98_01665 [Nannocystaceae bacterium]